MRWAHNKCDLPVAPGDRPAGVITSALCEKGIDALLEAISQRLVPEPPPPGAAVPFTVEQVSAVMQMRAKLEEAGRS